VEGEDFVRGIEDALGNALMATAAEAQLPSQGLTMALAPSSLAVRSMYAGWNRARSWPILGGQPLRTTPSAAQ